jgi:ketosteroid isomerase-like protein
MVRRGAVAGFLMTFAAAVVAAQAVPRDLAAMADTEREFAKTATVKGWRDAFLDFFADDAIALAPEPTSAKDRLRKQPSTPPSEVELLWEPRLGDVAASGDLGWLTGPSTSINHKAKDPKPGHGCYLSIWRRQPDGAWRVFIDVGVGAPTPASFAPGLTRMPFGGRYAGKGPKAAAAASLASADRDLNAQITAVGPSRAFAGGVTSSSRLHRPGFVPVVGADAIAAWLAEHASTATAKDGAAEAAAAGDFGYTYGTYAVQSPKPATGAYVRIWNRDAAGRWWLMVDVAQPARP